MVQALVAERQSGTNWDQFHEAGAYLRPAAVFDGDERVIASDYAACMSDNWYVQTAPRFVAAAEVFGIPVTAEQYEREKRVLGAACWVDDWLDEVGADTAERFSAYESAILSGLDGDLENAADRIVGLSNDRRMLTAGELLGNAVQPLPASDQEKFARLALVVGKLGRQKMMARDVRQYRFLTYGEGYHTGRLFAWGLTAGTADSPAVRSYGEWMGRSLGFFTVRDSRQDLDEDYAEGRTLVKPTVAAKLALATGQLALIKGIALDEPGRSASRAMKAAKERLHLSSTH